ncbi:sensor protein ZraS [bacterium BMS3Bbin07]|nr:sensor protein ZraS [bacterium BMS3Bbin07]HDH02293.1 GHKL domain-containing protein [Nitrospirota bacterium]
MKQSYSFCTDDRLCINSWGNEITEVTGMPSSAVLGMKYYEVLPRILADDRDALSVALADKTPMNLKGYSFNCLHDRVKADVRIDPVRVSSGKVDELRIEIRPYSACSMARKLQNSQRLIDIGKIASTLAHGVRNPLNAIKGSVVYLREKYSNEQTLIEFTRIMEEEITRLDNFISKFLSTSISVAGLSESDVNALLKKIEIYTSLQTHANDISADYEYGDIPLVAIDSFQLEQAVLNVINNAIEAMGAGGHLSVKTMTQKVSDNDFVLIEISDTGPGMADNGLGDISPETRGRGFGLFITREILQYYGGFLEIKSKKGAGTTVRLYLRVSR